jgi:antitoxin CptB
MPTEQHRGLDAGHSTPDRQRSTPDSQRSTQTDDRSRARLRWRCRRGMLENDLILTRFLDEVAALDRLLDLADNELWDLLSGRAEPEDATLRPLVALLRAA